MDAWVKLYSKFKYWKWYKKQNVKDVFIHCLISANWKDSKFENVDVPRGSFVTSYKKMSEELGMSVQEVRTALRWLKSTQELTITTYAKFTVIAINNYQNYQEPNTIPNSQLTGYQHAPNTQLTTIEEYKNIRILDIDERNNACVRAREEKPKEEVFEYNWLDDDETH